MKNTTLCYIEKDGAYLMIHRVKKKNDENKDKWIGIGGKLEAGESPFDCARREVLEETGLTLENIRYRGIITFVSNIYGTEYMHLFTATGFEIGLLLVGIAVSFLVSLLAIKLLMDFVKKHDFKLFGYPEWQIYAGSNLEAMYEVDTYFYTSSREIATLPSIFYRKNFFSSSVLKCFPLLLSDNFFLVSQPLIASVLATSLPFSHTGYRR